MFKPAKEAKILTEQMITNSNLFEVRGARDCDFLRRTDADDSHMNAATAKNCFLLWTRPNIMQNIPSASKHSPHLVQCGSIVMSPSAAP